MNGAEQPSWLQGRAALQPERPAIGRQRSPSCSNAGRSLVSLRCDGKSPKFLIISSSILPEAHPRAGRDQDKTPQNGGERGDRTRRTKRTFVRLCPCPKTDRQDRTLRECPVCPSIGVPFSCGWNLSSRPVRPRRARPARRNRSRRPTGNRPVPFRVPVAAPA